jgi:Gram-negative bacterial TonB protein C-terminal
MPKHRCQRYAISKNNVIFCLMIPILRYILLFLILSSTVPTYAFNRTGIDSTKCNPFIDSISKMECYWVVDSMPEYPGGQNEMLRFFITNFNYPNEIDACCKVTVEFIIDSIGEMVQLRIFRGLQADFDNETLRVMRLMPKWRPGKCNGKPVSVKFHIFWNVELN